MPKSLVIVESPTKARTITRFLGKDFVVKASNGHVRDLPDSAAEVPPKLKKEAWAKLGVNVESDFEPLYVVPASKKDNLKELREAMKDAGEIYLATDEDREGESISWHLVEALHPKVPVRRLVFHEITREAIEEALKSPRDINQNLVRAQETRRIVDRLFGYEVSPLLWIKMLPRLSAGRVQSVAVRLLVERERERIRFREGRYWSLSAVFGKLAGTGEFEAELTHVGDRRIAIGRDFDPVTGRLRERSEAIVLGEAEARRLAGQVLEAGGSVEAVEEKPFSTSPPAPFVTSTLQQEANRRLRLSARRTMSIAQQLYENGFITYMRTDSTTLSDEALRGARAAIARDFGAAYLPAGPRQYKTKVKNAQEAHEAIRPAGESFVNAAAVRDQLGPDAARLYEMILLRTLASQMENARGTRVTVRIRSGDGVFRAAGKTIEFPGFLRAYEEGADEAEGEEENRVLPKLAQGERLAASSTEPLERATQPPPRYTEGTLIRELERLGIGRPSTWATIVDLVLQRSYAFQKGTTLIPTFVALAVVGLLEQHFTNLSDYEFTARLEDDLDAISRGEAESLRYLRSFYFGDGFPGLRALVERGQTAIDPRDVCSIPIGASASGDKIEVRIGRYGPYLTDGTQRAGVPDGMAPDELTLEVAEKLLHNASQEPQSLGAHPETGLPIYLKTGRFGPYVQLGDASGDQKPKMASLLPNMKAEEVDLELALRLLALPRELGPHPEDGQPVLASNGKFGPYVKWGSEIRSIPLEETSPLDITLEKALELLSQPKGRRGASAKPALLRELGPHPVSEAPLKVLAGRFGPYVTDGTLNASLRRDQNPDTLTVDEAVALLEARASREPSARPRGRRAAATPKKTKAKAGSRSRKKSA